MSVKQTLLLWWYVWACRPNARRQTPFPDGIEGDLVALWTPPNLVGPTMVNTLLAAAFARDLRTWSMTPQGPSYGFDHLADDSPRHPDVQVSPAMSSCTPEGFPRLWPHVQAAFWYMTSSRWIDRLLFRGNSGRRDRRMFLVIDGREWLVTVTFSLGRIDVHVQEEPTHTPPRSG